METKSIIQLLWDGIETKIIQRNPTISSTELEQYISQIKAGAYFLTNFKPAAQKISITAGGQSISFELFFDPLLRVWKTNISDANENMILSNITISPCINVLNGYQPKYTYKDENGNDAEEDLILKGMFMTEPLGQTFVKYERGIESSPFAFTKDKAGVCACGIVYFLDESLSKLFEELLNEEERVSNADFDEMDYTIG